MRASDTSTRLAITGIGIICSIGRNQSEVWQSIVESRDGIGKLTKFPGESFPTDVAAEVGEIPGAAHQCAVTVSCPRGLSRADGAPSVARPDPRSE